MCKGNFLKTISSFMLVTIMIINIFVPCISVFAESTDSASTTMNFPSPVFKGAPEYSYEICTPDVDIDISAFEQFAPELTSGVSQGAPIISSVTAIAGPNDSVSVQGEGFEGGTVWVYGLDKEGNGMFTAAKTTSINDTTANAIISEKYRFGMYLVWVESADGILSRPVRVNAPELTWIGSDTVAPGQEVYLYGKNLTKDNVDGNSNVYITNGTSYYKAEISDVNAYRISVTIPSGLADGNYKIWVHNGHGCSYGWSNGLSFAVEADSEDFWASGTTHTVTQVSGVNGLLWKINYTAKDGDTIYLKNGTYEISSIANTSYNAGIVVKKALRFVGESRDGVKIVSSMKNSSGTFVSGSNCMAIAAFPSEFQNITFVDNVNDFGTDNANIAGVYSTFLKAWGYLALYSSLGNKNVDSFKIDNCSFVVNRLRHSKSADTTDSQIDAALKEKYDYYAGAGVGWTSPLTIDAIKNVEITNCHFESSIGFMCYSAQKVLIEGCTSAGNWIEYGNSDSAFCYLQYCKNIDVSRNEIHGKDYYTDPDGKLERYDLGFGRGIVIQNTYASTDATYIAENDVRRCGEFDGGSGEQILYENLHTIYCGSINGISSDGKTVTLGDSVWEKQDDGSYAYRVNTSVTKVVIGTRLWVFGGKGESQYRTVVGVTADNNVILDRPFDVELATAAQENPSLVCITYANENAVVFRNYCEGPEDYDDNFNSTIGVQLYATMLDFIGAENLFTQMHQGFYLDAHYNFDLSNRFGYNGYEETIIINNTIHDVRIGVECTVAIFGLTDSILDGTPNPANLIHNVMIRGNEISETVLCENWLWASNGDYYNSLEKSGATCVMVGVTDDAVKYGNTVLWPGDWIRNTVIENNDFANAEMALMRIGYYQCGTVVRNNYCQGRGDEDDTILYDGPEIDVELEINRATVINDYGTEAEGVYGTVANLESFDEFMNPDFSEGFKYWGSNNGQGYACDHARLVTEGTETYLEMADSIGITSVDFKPKNIPVNSKVAVVYDWKGSENVKVELAGYGLAGGSFEKTTFTNSDVADGWNRSITSYALTTTQDLDFNVVINSLIHKQKSYVRNIEFVIVYENQGYYETADGRKYNLLDGSEYGGSETKGIQTLNSEDIHKYGPTLGIANNSFEDGLKFWKLSGTATDTISAADGQLVFSSTASANGVISAPFKVQQGAYKDNSANNRVAIILDYVCLKTTSSYYTVYLYESKNGAAPTRYKLTWDTGFKTIDAQTKNVAYSSTLSWSDDAVYNIEILTARPTFISKINSVSAARYDANATANGLTGVVTDIENGSMYVYNTTAEQLDSVSNMETSVVTPNLKNGDFSEGSNGWVGDATASNGKLTVNSGEVKSTKFKLDVTDGTKFTVIAEYAPTGSGSVVLVSVDSSGIETVVSTATYSASAKATTLTPVEYNSQNSYYITLTGKAAFDNIRVATVNSDATYTDTLTGEICGSDGIKLGGTYEDGYYSNASALGDIIGAPQNLDFSDGFKYWTSGRNVVGYATEVAALNPDGSVTIDAGIYQGISTMRFTLPNAQAGKKFVVSYEATGVNVCLRVFKNNSSPAICSMHSAPTATYPSGTIDFWNSLSATIEISSVSDDYTLDFQLWSEGVAKIRNVRVMYVDEGGTGLYMNVDNTPDGYDYGDANADGLVDLRDLVRIKKYLVDNTQTIYLASANADKDASLNINASDIALILDYILTGKKEF